MTEKLPKYARGKAQGDGWVAFILLAIFVATMVYLSGIGLLGPRWIP